jgi:hypothetical protein
MKSRSLPDWLAPVLAWAIAAIVVFSSATKPEGVFVYEKLKFLLPLLAVAWTAGFVAMRQLKQRHQEEYARLGRPSLFGPPFETSTWRFKGYLFGFRFLRLKDRVVTVGFSTMLTLTVVGVLWLLLIWKNA